MGKQRRLSNQGSFYSFQSAHCLAPRRKSASLTHRGKSNPHPGARPDEVLTMPNWFVVLEGFPVVSHGFPVANQQNLMLKRWCRNINLTIL